MSNVKAFVLALMLAALPVCGAAEGVMLGVQVKDTPAPTALSTGRLSPVRADSSTVPCPAVTMPSTGILPP